jgi:shikimate kinase
MSTATLEMPTTLPTRTKAAVRCEVPKDIDRIVLTGFMGSGKTTAGRLLASQLGWSFLDLDREIEAREALAGRPRSVPEIFADLGEAHFRHLESSMLATLLGQRRVVIALGGGAPEELGNRLLLEQTPRTAIVHLSAPLEVLLERCQAESQQLGAVARPVLADPDRAAARFVQRRPLYERLATHHIDTTEHTPEDTSAAILFSLQRLASK